MPAVSQEAVSVIVRLTASLKYSRVLVKIIALSVNNRITLCHRAIYRIKIVGSGFRRLPALYHVSVLIIAYPLAYPVAVCVQLVSPFTCT